MGSEQHQLPSDLTATADQWRWTVKQWVGSHSKLRALRNCGHHHIPGYENVTIRRYKNQTGDLKASVHNVTWCNSVWACPDCSKNLAMRRAAYLSELCKAWHSDGNQLGFITLTMRHDASMPLKDIIEAAAQPNTTAGLGTKYGSRLGITKSPTLAIARAAEITHGKNGWHYHLHFLIFLPGWCDAADLEDIRHRMWIRWSDHLAQSGFDCDEKQSDARFIMKDEGIGAYLIKAGLEVAAGTTKHGKKENQTPFQILGDIIKHTYSCTRKRHDQEHCPDYIHNRNLWWEYETATKGRRQLIMPLRLGDYYGIDRAHLDHHLETENQADLSSPIMNMMI